MNVNIHHDKKNKTFYTEINNEICTLKYSKVNDNILDYRSTFVPPNLRGQNLAAMLVKYALEYAKNNNLTIIPSCSYVNSYIKKHPEYTNLISN